MGADSSRGGDTRGAGKKEISKQEWKKSILGVENAGELNCR